MTLLGNKEHVTILCVGDVVGGPGRSALKALLPALQQEHKPDVTIVNIENVANGFGINLKTYSDLSGLDIDAFTSGNHAFDKKESLKEWHHFDKLIRPYNFPKKAIGEGYIILDKGDVKVAVINAMGRVFMPLCDCPFQAMASLVQRIKDITPIIVVDFHAEATSEKQAMGWFLDGKVSCVYGTHTHVATADEQVLHHGTSFISDIGMTGAKYGILGMDRDPIISKFLTQMPVKFEPSDSTVKMLNGIKVVVHAHTGRTVSIHRIKKEWEAT